MRATFPAFAAAALLGLASLVAGANAAEHKGAAEATGPVPGTIIVFGDLSVPVVSGKKVRRFDYAAVAISVADVAKQKSLVCDRKFQLADAFLLHLHGHPFTLGAAQEGPAARAALLELAKQVVGADVVGGLELAWAPNPQPLTTKIFGRATDVLCTGK